jgi:hypothetical protein
MKTNSKIIGKSILLVIAYLFLASGCAKKDDGKTASVRSSIGSGRTGAQPVDSQSSQVALDAAASQGVFEFYVDTIYQPQVVNQNYSQAIGVEASVRINNQTIPLVTYHEVYSNGSVSQMLQKQVGQLTVFAQGVCGDSNCDSYYLLLTVRKGNTGVVQLAQRQNFNGGGQNVLSYRKPQEFIQNLQMLFAVLGQPTVQGYF